MQGLVERLKNRDDVAFRELMKIYKIPLYRYIKTMVRNEELAEELTQDTFVKVYFKIGTMRTDNLKSWIYTIATNLVRSEFRKKRIKDLLSLSDVKESEISYTESEDEKEFVWKLISGLPEKYRIPIIMKEINGFTFEEISEMLKKPVSSIKTLVYRGKERMKKSYRTIEMIGNNLISEEL